MKVTVTPILTGARGANSKGLVKGLEDLEIEAHVETIQPTSLSVIGQNTKERHGH